MNRRSKIIPFSSLSLETIPEDSSSDTKELLRLDTTGLMKLPTGFVRNEKSKNRARLVMLRTIIIKQERNIIKINKKLIEDINEEGLPIEKEVSITLKAEDKVEKIVDTIEDELKEFVELKELDKTLGVRLRGRKVGRAVRRIKQDELMSKIIRDNFKNPPRFTVRPLGK